jgi:hypothetical protein
MLPTTLFETEITTLSQDVGKSTNTSRICYYLDRNISYLSELQLRRNLAYEILCRLSPTKKWAGILTSTTLLLTLILNKSDVLVFLVTNYPVRNRNDYTVPRCRLSLYKSSFILSVINLWNSLDDDTRNTRTSDLFKINVKSKVVLVKIPAHFLVGDRRHNISYAFGFF